MKLLSIALFAAVAATPAFAGDFYVVGSVGQAQFDLDQNDLSNLNSNVLPNGFTGNTSLTKSDTAYKIQFGYQFNDNFAIEGGYVDLGKAKYSADGHVGAVSYTENANFKFSGLNIAAVGILPINESFSVFGKLGVINAKAEADLSAQAPGYNASGSASSTNVRGNWGIGATYNLNKQLAFRVEAEQFSKLGDDNSTGKKIDVNLLSAGVQYKF
jgi:OOP family OmpA-OmpF porin